LGQQTHVLVCLNQVATFPEAVRTVNFAQLTNRWRWIIGIGLALIITAAVSQLEFQDAKLTERIYRIGLDNNPPQHFLRKDGKPDGLAVDLVNEAARRRGIRLQWVLEPESSEAALKAKKVDLWPMMTILPERKGVVYITEPYREDAVCIVVRTASTVARLEDLSNSTIVYDGSPLDNRKLCPRLPNARLVAVESPKEKLKAVCERRADAAYFDEYSALATLFDGISCGEEGLRIIPVPELNGLLGVGATFEARPAANAIREEIGRMSEDGTLARIAARWHSFSSRNLEVTYELARARIRERWLDIGMSAVVVLFLVTLWQAARIRRTLAIAMEATKLKNQFLANMSHEIRTPMNAVLGMTALAMETPDRDEERGYLKDVMDAGESLLSLLNDILDLSKIEAGKISFEHRDFDPADVVQEVRTLLSKGAGTKGLELICQVPDSPGYQVRGDPLRLRQILVNLVGNAIKFTEVGHVDLVVTVDSESDQLIRMRFAVKDTGIGISKGAQRRIFQSFVQGDGSVTRKYGGTGLGLSISRELIGHMGGELLLESSPGRGSTFWFVLPFETAQGPSESVPDQDAPNESVELV
jgi:signal transduction histidine kinase